MLRKRLQFLAVLTPRQRVALLPIFVLTILSSGLEVFGLGLLIPFFKYLSDPSSIQKLPDALQKAIGLLPGTTANETIGWMAALLVAVFVLKGIISIFATWLQTHIVYRLYRAIATRVLANHLNAPITFLTSRNSAEIIRIVANDTRNFFTGYIIPALKLMAEIVPMIAIVITMLIVDPRVTAVAVLGLGVLTGLMMAGMRKLIVRWGRIVRDAYGMMMRWVSQGVGGIKEVQVLGTQHYITQEYDTATATLARAAELQSVALASPRYVVEALVVATLVVFTLILQGGGEPVSVWMPRLVFFGAASIRLAPAATRVLTYVNTLRGSQAYAEVVDESLHRMPQHVLQERKRQDAVEFAHQVEFRDVQVLYPNSDTAALNGLNLTIHHGETVALVGPTGAGKTTAIDVLLGLIRPTKGALFVDDTDITNQEQRWQPRLGYVPQFIYLADLSIRENVAFGVPPADVDEQRIWKALQFSAIDDFVRAQPNGLETHIGERGVTLSGGQRQRIGIARALYFDPEILVMDEATSALDSETEQKISDATQKLQGSVTMVLIAHRITTVRHADRIIVMDQGKISDEGTFDELIERSALFRRLAKGLEGVDDAEARAERA